MLPSTPPAALDAAGPVGGDHAPSARDTDPTSPVPAAARPDRPARTVASRPEPEYLIKGTGCTEGHARGHELETGRLGRVPTRRSTRIGLFLVLWCAIGLGLVVDLRWLSFGLQVLALWLAFAAVVVRRAGHRGHCWRTRAWRHAWGGLAPTGRDATRAART